MDLTRKRVAAAGAIGAAALLGAAVGAIHAGAVSGGGYSYGQQGCSATADRNDRPNSTEKGCHSFTAQVNQGGGAYPQRYHPVSLNLDQTPVGTSAHSGSVVLDPGQGTAYTVKFDTGQGQFLNLGLTSYPLDVLSYLLGFPGDAANPPLPNVGQLKPGTPSASFQQGPSKGRFDTANPADAQVYVGADDNLDNGEHDGVSPVAKGARPVANGPSDGGAVQANTHLQGNPSNPQSLAGNASPTDRHNPVRAADAGFGECADGQCVAADTERRRIYQGGCRRCSDQSVYSDQSSTNWRSPDCNSGSLQNQNECATNWQSCKDPADTGNLPENPPDCDDAPISQPYSERGGYYTDPGVMVYEDPDPQSSPVLPMYPICEEYVGTEGVYTCGKPGVNPPAGMTPAAPTPARTPVTSTNHAPAHVPAAGRITLGAGPGGR